VKCKPGIDTIASVYCRIRAARPTGGYRLMWFISYMNGICGRAFSGRLTNETILHVYRALPLPNGIRSTEAFAVLDQP